MKKITTAILAALITFTAAPLFAQEEATSLNELLRRVEQGRVSEQRELQQREAEFRQQRSEQQRLLQQAQGQRRTAEQRSEQLEASYEAKELQIADVQEQLNTRLGSLRELFGVLQQVAGDTQGLLEVSLTSAQYPDRGEFLLDLAQKMGTSSKLASIDEIEQLWFELQREMTLQGEVARFTTTVITADGNQQEMPVVRVGTFNIVADGKYLMYTPETGNVSELPRQPDQARYTNTTEELLEADGGMVTFALDPTSGQLLSALIQSPTLVERIQQGGLVGYIIIGLGILGLLIAIERFIVLSMASGKVSSQLKSDAPRADNPLGRVLKVAEENKSKDVETLELKLSEAILQETPALNRSLLFLKIISVVAPLLGLLGTVTGMIVTFQAITLFGTGDPKLMAGGISQALVTTVLGLAVAIPMVLLHTLVSGRSKRIIHVLQEQAAGIIAERSERHG